MSWITSESSLEEVFQDVWKELARAAHDKHHPFRYFSIATMGDKSPGLRTVVLRQVDLAERLWCYTDWRTPKVQEMKANPSVALLFYHPNKKVQVRLDASVVLHHGDAVAQTHWNNVQGNGRKAYQAIISPGETIATPEDAHHWPDELTDEFFCAVEIVPVVMEVLQLNQLTHIRMMAEAQDEGWQLKWIAP